VGDKSLDSQSVSEGGAIALLPHKGWGEGENIPADLVGAEILFFGSVPQTAELVIDYRTNDHQTKRLVLGFTERGMWIENETYHLPNQGVNSK
jgi:hypothetical protein